MGGGAFVVVGVVAGRAGSASVVVGATPVSDRVADFAASSDVLVVAEALVVGVSLVTARVEVNDVVASPGGASPASEPPVSSKTATVTKADMVSPPANGPSTANPPIEPLARCRPADREPDNLTRTLFSRRLRRHGGPRIAC